MHKRDCELLHHIFVGAEDVAGEESLTGRAFTVIACAAFKGLHGVTSATMTSFNDLPWSGTRG